MLEHMVLKTQHTAVASLCSRAVGMCPRVHSSGGRSAHTLLAACCTHHHVTTAWLTNNSGQGQDGLLRRIQTSCVPVQVALRTTDAAARRARHVFGPDELERTCNPEQVAAAAARGGDLLQQALLAGKGL